MKRATAGRGGKLRDTPCGEGMLSAGAGTPKTNRSATGHMQRFVLMGPRQETMTHMVKVANVIRGPALTLTDNKHLCVHAGYCIRAGGIWNLVRKSENPEARYTAIEEACTCPPGRLVICDNATGEAIEPELEKSIVLVECPSRGEQGPLWVRGGIPIESSDGRQYGIRNRVILCRCGKSKNKPFCDGSHVEG